MHLDVVRGGATELHHRGCEAQDLFDCTIEVLAWIALGLGPLIGELQERIEAVRQRVASGLVACNCEQQHEQVKLVLAELLIAFGRQQHGDDVLAWLNLACCGQLVGVHVQLAHRGLRHVGGATVFGVGVTDHCVRPGEHLVAVFDGQTKQLGNGHQGKLGGNLGDEVEAVFGNGLGHDGAGDLAVVALHRADDLGREAAADQCAQAGLLRWIEVDDHARHLEVGTVFDHDRALEARREVLPLTVGLDHVGVTTNDPVAIGWLIDLALRMQIHRGLVTQTRKAIVRHRVDEYVVAANVDFVGECHFVLQGGAVCSGMFRCERWLMVDASSSAHTSSVFYRSVLKMSPLVGTPVPAVTSTFSTLLTGFTEVPRI